MKKNTTIVLMSCVTALSKVFGFLRDIALSWFVGANRLSDLYILATSIPGILFGFFSTTITSSYIPIYESIRKEESEKSARLFTSNLLRVFLILFTIFVIFVHMFTDQIIAVFNVPNLSSSDIQLFSIFIRICVLEIYVSGSVALVSAFLQIKGNYLVTIIIGIPLNVFLIITYFIYSLTENTWILSWGYVLSSATQLCVLIPFCFKNQLQLLKKDQNFLIHGKKFIVMVLPMIVGVSLTECNMLIDRLLSVNILTGGVTVLNYGNRLLQFVTGLVLMPIITYTYPKISRYVKNKRFVQLQGAIESSLELILLLTIPVSFGVLLFGKDIVHLCFGHGALDDDVLQNVTNVFVCYTLGLCWLSVRELSLRIYYAFQETKKPMIISLIGLLLNILLNIILSAYFGLSGLAIGTTIANVVCCVWMLYDLRNIIKNKKPLIKNLIKMMLSSLLMLLFAVFVQNVLIFQSIIKVFVLIPLCVLVYFLCLKKLGYKMKIQNSIFNKEA